LKIVINPKVEVYKLIGKDAKKKLIENKSTNYKGGGFLKRSIIRGGGGESEARIGHYHI